jgi:hypothetical protein
VQGRVALGELFQIGDGGSGSSGVGGWVSGDRVEQSEHGATAGDGVFSHRQHLGSERGAGSTELIEQVGGFVKQGDQ